MEYDPIQHIKRTIDLNEEKEALIRSCLRPIRLKKKSFLLRQSEVCLYMSYIKSGCLRVYFNDEQGQESNVFFALEDWWVMDLESFMNQTPGRFSIESLETSELIQIHEQDFNRLVEAIPQLEKWLRKLFQNALISSENRIYYKSTLSAELRYERFLSKYPSLESRIPQKHIASYLGVSPEFLSNLKAKRWKSQKP